VSLRGAWNLPANVGLDLWFRYVDALTENDVDGYNTLDARLAWSPWPELELSAVGQNLLQPNHREFSSIEIERAFYLKVDWVF
jgi:iron complex outermembrane receptor protein